MNIVGVLNWLFVLITVVLAVPAAVFLLEVCSAPRRFRSDAPVLPGHEDGADRAVKVAVLVPAHNEAGGILSTLESLKAQCSPGDRILVVADNCSDDTAAIARAAGVDVVERTHATERGKGYALNHGVRAMEAWSRPPEVVVIVDADCTLGPHALAGLARQADVTGRPAQARYLMHAAPGASLKVRVAEFAWVVKNALRPAGLAAYGLPCQLTGSGMSFPWPLIRQAPLANGHLVEDMKLGLDLASQGRAPLFCAAATVHSQFPTQEAGLQSQRQRWERGHLSVILDQGIALLGRGVTRRDPDLLAMALDNCVPPLASLVLAQSACAAMACVWAIASGQMAPAIIAAVGLGAVAFAVIRAWRHHGRTLLSGRDLLAIPSYVLAKVPIYAAAILGRRLSWVRTAREHEQSTKPGPRPPSS